MSDPWAMLNGRFSSVRELERSPSFVATTVLVTRSKPSAALSPELTRNAKAPPKPRLETVWWSGVKASRASTALEGRPR